MRSRGLFGSRTHLTLVSQEQELYGTYDPEEAQADSKYVSPSSPFQKSVPFLSGCPQLPPLLSPQDFTQSPLLPPLPVLPALPPLATTPPPPRDSIRLIPNRRPPSLDNIRSPPPINPDRFSNPATKVSRSRSRPNLRSQIGAWTSRTQTRGASSPPRSRSADHERGRSYLDRGSLLRW
jgi:hypothetical protein